MSYIGDVTATTAYTQWAAQVKANGGVATNWPFSDQYLGQPAARYDNATFYLLFDASQIDPSALYEATADASYVYVLAPPSVTQAAQSLTVPSSSNQTGPDTADSYLHLLSSGASAIGTDLSSGVAALGSSFVPVLKWGAITIGGFLLIKAFTSYQNAKGR